MINLRLYISKCISISIFIVQFHRGAEKVFAFSQEKVCLKFFPHSLLLFLGVCKWLFHARELYFCNLLVFCTPQLSIDFLVFPGKKNKTGGTDGEVVWVFHQYLKPTSVYGFTEVMTPIFMLLMEANTLLNPYSFLVDAW